jgi:hypothetical protein
MSDLFEVLDEDEFKREQALGASEVPDAPKRTRSKREPKTEPRNFTTWYGLPTVYELCSMDRHAEVQDSLNEEEKAYRQRLPQMMVYELHPGIFICRDCFLQEVDKEDEATHSA